MPAMPDYASALALVLKYGVTSPVLTTPGNLFVGPVRPGPNGLAVFVLASGGPPPDDQVGMTTARYYGQAQVRVRSVPEEYQDGAQLARDCHDVCHQAVVTGYHDVRCLESTPNYLGQDDDKRHEWSFTVEMWWTA